MTGAARWSVFPLWPVTEDGKCTCSDPSCEAAGKHPQYPYGSLANGECVRGPEGCGYGIATGERSGIFVLDFDGPDAMKALAARGLPDTYAVRTARGAHLYYRMPSFPVRNSASEISPGVDVRGDGGFVVAPGSRHRTGFVYEVIDERQPVDAPAWLLEWPGLKDTKKVRAASVNAPIPVDVATPEGERRITLAVDHLKNAPASVQGKNGSAALWGVAVYLVRTLELPHETCAALIQEHFNPRCEPQWSPQEIWHKLEDARDKSDRPTGIAPEGFGERIAELAKPALMRRNEERPARAQRKQRAQGHQYTHETGNAAAAERKKLPLSDAVHLLTTLPEWEGVFQYDTFRKRLIAVDPPIKMDAETTGLSNADLSAVRQWFEANGVAISKLDVADAIESAALKCAYHPVREYLEGLPAAQRGAIERMCKEAIGVTDTLAIDFVTKTLIGAVRRVLQPGCQVDTMLVLFGPQGAKKTTLVRALFGEDFTRSQMPDLGTKDASEALNGFWGVELAELDRVLRAESSTVKEFLTRTFDDYRPPYGKNSIRFARECVFVGTTNEGEFLRDITGNRRYWPIELTGRIAIDWILAHRDAVWSEALALANAGVPHWFEDEQQADAAREPFMQDHPWREAIEEYCKGRERVTSPKVYEEAIARGDTSLMARVSKREIMTVTEVLSRLGCVQKRTKHERYWIVAEYLTKATPSAAEIARRGATSLAKKLGSN